MRGRLLTFASVKGGAGASTLACLSAGALSRVGAGPALLLDWDRPGRGGMEALLGRTDSWPCLSELSSRRGALSSGLLRGLARKHPLGFDMLSLEASAGKTLEAEFLTEALEVLRELYPVILGDVDPRGPSMDRAVGASDLILAVFRPDPAGLSALRAFEAEMASRQHSAASFRLLANKVKGRPPGLAVAREASPYEALDILMESAEEELDRAQETGRFPDLEKKSRLGEAASKLAEWIARPGAGKGAVPAPALSKDADRGRAALREKLYRRLLAREDLLAPGPAGSDLTARVRAAAEDLVASETAGDLSRDERLTLVRELVREAVGLGPLEDLLADPEVTEIMANGPGRLYVERKGLLHKSPQAFASEAQLRSVMERIVGPLGRRIDEASPMADARLPDGSRVNAVIPPLALDGPLLTIRKFPGRRLGLDDLVAGGSLSSAMGDFLSAALRGKLNILISGGTGSGKTTLLNIAAGRIAEAERIVTIEDSAELSLGQEHVLRLEARPPNLEGRGEITIRDLVRNALRMRPDRIVVGECRGGEALDMLQAMNTGHDGSLSTGHANSPRDMLSRLETMVLMSGVELPSRAIREQIASALDLIVHVARFRDGSRKVESIVEVLGLEGDVIVTQPLFQFQTESYKDGLLKGRFSATGILPRCFEDLELSGSGLSRDIFARND